jgi:hypothetical protein
MKKEINYEQDVQIDENALDLEWLEQAPLMMKYIEHASEKEKERDEKKEKLDFVAAQLDKEVRDHPELFGIAKVTESTVEAAIKRSTRYQGAAEDYIEAKYEARIARGAVDAIHDRKEALQELGRLLNLGYFAPPMTPRDLSGERIKQKQQETKLDADISENLGQRRRSRKDDTTSKGDKGNQE